MSCESEQARFWYCVKTQTKREHIAAEHLRTLEEVEVFCPRLRYRKATRRGKIWWVEALFPGYLLARFDLVANERAVTYTQGVAAWSGLAARCHRYRKVLSRPCAMRSISRRGRRGRNATP